MSIRAPFMPKYGSNQVVSPASSSAEVTIGKGSKTIRVRNTGSNIGYFRTGVHADATVVATTADVPVASGETVYIEKPQDHDTAATISASGTTFQMMAGEGGF